MSKNFIIALLLTATLACHEPKGIPAGDLATEYLDSKAAVRTRHQGKPIRVTGYAKTEAIMPDGNLPEGLVVLGEGDGQVDCRFTRKEADAFARVRAGEQITVEGIFNGERGLELRFCRLSEN